MKCPRRRADKCDEGHGGGKDGRALQWMDNEPADLERWGLIMAHLMAPTEPS